MKVKIKKLLALVLSATILMSVFSITANASNENEVVVHYYNENNWSNPYIYFYNESNEGYPWPGATMNFEGDAWYTYTISNYSGANVIFSDNGANQNPAQNEPGFWVEGEKWYKNGIWYDTKPIAETTTVHYYNSNGWSTPYIYYYSDNSQPVLWPGCAMTNDGNNWYSFTISDLSNVKVVFSNNGSEQNPAQNQEGYSVSGEMWYKNGEWTTETPEETNKITVYFYKPDNWSTPNIYYYKTESDTGPAWPGSAMTSVDGNWYSYTITEYSSAKVLFNSGSNQIPAQNQPGFDVSGVMWYKDGVMCNGETDADNDELPDYMEMILGTNLNNTDTDSDNLPDGYEVLTLGTDPAKADSDLNGINDNAEDADADSLTNLDEYNLTTNPTQSDTDDDGLSDYEEVYTYNSNPLTADTDGDILSDGDDVALGFSPLLQDTDSDGILDCDEKVEQEITQEISCEEAPQITEVQISFEGTGNINSTTTIENIYGIDMLSSGVEGLIGAPVEISTSSEFETAVITFTYDEALLGDIPEENLAIMWYDEENGVYQILDQDTVLDKENNTLSYTTTHFSKYMVVDKEVWYNTWRTNIDYREGTTTPSYYDFALVVDVSSSMAVEPRINTAKEAMHNFVDCLSDNDNACLVSFTAIASLRAPLGSTKEKLHDAITRLYPQGGTTVSSGLSLGLNQLLASTSSNKKAVILICDGDVDNVQPYVDTAIENNIKIFTINVVSSDNSTLQSIADQTGGEYYHAYTSEELLDAFNHLVSDSILEFDLTDTDDDGLPDTFERNGMRLSNGKVVFTNPDIPDTDGDGLSDGEEMGTLRSSSSSGGLIDIPLFRFEIKPLYEDKMYIGKGTYSTSTMYFNNTSDPSKRDSDDDTLQDNEDPYSLKFNTFVRYNRKAVTDYCDKYAKEDKNTEKYGYLIGKDCANFASQCLHAGGIPMNDKWYHHDKGIVLFYWKDLFEDYSHTWSVAYDNYEYFKNNKGVVEEEIQFNSKEEMQEALMNGTYNIQPGDLMYMQWNEEIPHHATIIYSVDSDTLTYSGHTRDCHDNDIFIKFWNKYPDCKLYILRIKDVVIV